QVLRPIPQLESIYSQAVAHRSEIRSAELEIENARHGLGIARSGYYPTLSLSAGTGVGFRTGSDYTFAEQMKNSWSNTAGLSLNVPILQGRQTRSNVEKAQLRQSMAQLSRESALKDLRRTIETTWLNARNAQQQFIAARAEQQAAQAGYELTQEQFRVGRATATDLLNQHTQLLSAQQRTLQAKYMAVYYAGLLQHYAQ
ncbi:MAG: TolC family protein, partial [Paludibacteraceae bacterium]|nr:TolC family protein [Paludibacteraceae bacterium]